MPIAARCVFECEGEYRSSLEIPFRIAPATIATRSRGLRSAVHADVFIRTMSGEAPGSSWRVFLWPFKKAVNRPLQRNGPSERGTLRPPQSGLICAGGPSTILRTRKPANRSLISPSPSAPGVKKLRTAEYSVRPSLPFWRHFPFAFHLAF